MSLRIWDNVGKKWLEPMAIYFGKDGRIDRITACDVGADPLTQGWYVKEGAALNKIAIVGSIDYNKHLINGK